MVYGENTILCLSEYDFITSVVGVIGWDGETWAIQTSIAENMWTKVQTRLVS